MAETVPFSSEYADRLFELTATYPLDRDDAAQLNVSGRLRLIEQLEDFKYAESSTQWSEKVPYIRIGEKGEHRPVLYVPGFTEGIEAKAPFAIELAKRGVEVILPGQNRKEILKDTMTGKRNATHSQAENYLDVLQKEGLLNSESSVDIVTHSYGSLIFEKMDQLARRRGQRCFNDARVVMLAPAGFNEKESLPRLAKRFVQMNISESKSSKDFRDETSEMFKAGVRNFLANIPRGLLECWELARKRLDYTTLASCVGRLTVLSYAKDALYPDKVLAPTMKKAIDERISWATPISLRSANDDPAGPLRAGEGATHNDEQFNPSRVAGAVTQILRAA